MRPGAKSTGANPGPLTPQSVALAHRRADGGQQRTLPARGRAAGQPCASSAVCLRGPRRESQTEQVRRNRSRGWRRGNAAPESFIPPVLRASASGLPRKHEKMLVGMRQLEAAACDERERSSFVQSIRARSESQIAGAGALLKVMDLLSVGDSSERRVLAPDKNAGVQHDDVQKASLTL